MARYVQQPHMGFPSQGAQNIEHLVEVFEETTPAALQTAINTFFTSLVALPEFPIIQDIRYEVYLEGNQGGDNPLYGALLHYILVD